MLKFCRIANSQLESLIIENWGLKSLHRWPADGPWTVDCGLSTVDCGLSLTGLNPVDGDRRKGQCLDKREGAQPVRGKGRAHPQHKQRKNEHSFSLNQGGLQAQKMEGRSYGCKAVACSPEPGAIPKTGKGVV